MIGYDVSNKLGTTLIPEALKMSIACQRPRRGVINPSNQGVQYISGDCVAEIKNNSFVISMARTDNPYENATIESFFKTLKC